MKNLIKTKRSDIEFYTTKNLEALQQELLYLLLIIDDVCKKNNLEYWLDGGTLLGLKRHNGFIPWDDDLDICLLKKDYDKLLPLLHERAKNDERIFLYFYKSQTKFWCEYLATTKFGKINRNKLQPYRIDIFPMKFVENSESDIDEDRRIGDIAGCYVLGKTKFHKNTKKELAKNNKLNILEKNNFLDFYNNEYMKRYQEIENHADFLLKKGHGNFSPLEFIEYNTIFPLKTGVFEGNEFPIPNKVHNYLVKSYGDYMKFPPVKKRIPFNEKIVRLEISKLEIIEGLKYELEQMDNLFRQSKIAQKLKSLWWHLTNGEIIKIFNTLFKIKN